MEAIVWRAAPTHEPAARGRDARSSSQVCLENIGYRERMKRLRFGVRMMAISIVVAAALIAIGADHWWRLGLFFPLATAATGFFQAYEKT